MKKKLLSILLATAMVLSVVACGNEDKPADSGNSNAGNDTQQSSEVEEFKLTTLKMMVDGTLNLTEETGLNEFEAAWEAAVGVDLVIDKPDHSGYSDALARALAKTTDRPDVVIMPAAMYAQYAAFDGVLWDMTEAYENSDFYNRMTRANVNEANYINGKLLGLSPAAGNGCLTYVKQTWLDAVGLSVDDIKTYDDFINMLTKFSTEDPDGNGVKGDTYGIIAAGIISNEAPWTNYLPEFWQSAQPAFVQDDNGTWIDGFQTEETKAALERLRDAWAKGLIDPDTSLFYGETKKTREKWFGADQTGSAGCFSYWAGTWHETLANNLAKNGLSDEIAELNLIAEMEGFIDRKAPVWVILDDGDGNDARENAIFEAFFETMLDGDKVQTMWMYGVENVHWSTKAETITLNAGTEKEKSTTYEEGQFHMLPTLTDPNSLYKKNHIDNLLAIAPLTNGIGTLSDMVDASNAHFVANAIPAPNTPSSETYSTQGSIVKDAVLVAVTSIVKDGVSYDEAMATYKDSCGSVVDTILAELNADK